MRRGVRRVLPARDRWHSLQEYAAGEANVQEFQLLRARDSAVSAAVAKSQASTTGIDWAAWEQRVGNKEVFSCLKDFHTQQTALLDSIAKEDHTAAVQGQTEGWELFEKAKSSCAHSVEKSNEILENGARALWISFQNPAISQLSQTEWLDADQYWQAFVEKHQFYHNHIASAGEDPESKEYEAKMASDIKGKWEFFDGKGALRSNNKLLYQRPSYEFYETYRAPLIEHMIYYLTRTGNDSRTFPECMPTKYFAEIYAQRFKLYNVLQRRRRPVQEDGWKREVLLDFHPEDFEHGEGHFQKLIAKETATTELAMARLMGNYILFSDSHVPVQTGMALYSAIQADEGKGTFYTLGADVHALFYKPAGEALAMPDPKDCFETLANHVSMTGRRFEVGYAAALEAFTEVLEARKEGHGGNWFTAPGETSREAFMRRLKKDDPAVAIYNAYAEEHAERWANAKPITMEEAFAQMPEIERYYQLECQEYNCVVLGLNDEFSSAGKQDQEILNKLVEADTLQAQLDCGKYVAIDGDSAVKKADELTASLAEFEAKRDKVVEAVLNTKLPGLERKK